MKNKIVHWFILIVMAGLYLGTSLISMVHVIDFFEMSNPRSMSIILAVAFEIGAMASLASIIIMDKMKKWIVWGLFILLTAFSAMGNTYFAYTHLENFQGWIELFGLNEMELITQKRILAIISGATLPVVALGFIKALIDYIKPETKDNDISDISEIEDDIKVPTKKDVVDDIQVNENPKYQYGKNNQSNIGVNTGNSQTHPQTTPGLG